MKKIVRRVLARLKKFFLFFFVESGRTPFETKRQKKGPLALSQKSYSRATRKYGWVRGSNGSSGLDFSSLLCLFELSVVAEWLLLLWPFRPPRKKRQCESGKHKTPSSSHSSPGFAD